MNVFMNVSLCIVIVFLASCNKLEDIFDHVNDKKDGDHPEFVTDAIETVPLFVVNQEGELDLDGKAIEQFGFAYIK